MPTHHNTLTVDQIVAAIGRLDPADLGRVQAALDRHRKQTAGNLVIQYRAHRDGVLQLEYRSYQRKDGTITRRGPYWFFRYRRYGKQESEYLGHADKVANPEWIVDIKLRRKEGR